MEGYTSEKLEKTIGNRKYFLKQQNLTAFKKHLKKITERPHVAGSETNVAVQQYMTEVMEKAGFEVKQYPYDLYLPSTPGSSLIEIVTPSRAILNQKEDIIPGDEYSKDPLLWKGWNAFSGSGT